MNNKIIKFIVQYIFKFSLFISKIFYNENKAFNKILCLGKIFSRQLYNFPFLYCISELPKDYHEIYRENFKEYIIPYHNKERCKGKIFYIHGGGFISGDFKAYGDFCKYLSDTLCRDVIFPEYRLNDMEKMSDDIYTSYQDNVKKEDNVVVICDNAGGYLYEILCEKLKNNLPFCSVLISPILTLDKLEISDNMIDKDLFNMIIEKVKNKKDISIDENIITLILYSSNECLRSEFEYDNLIYDYTDTFHCYPLFYRYFQEGQNGVEKIRKFINSIPRNYKI
jgi:hypothetical protein